jgi:hypothetical protein
VCCICAAATVGFVMGGGWARVLLLWIMLPSASHFATSQMASPARPLNLGHAPSALPVAITKLNTILHCQLMLRKTQITQLILKLLPGLWQILYCVQVVEGASWDSVYRPIYIWPPHLSSACPLCLPCFCKRIGTWSS